MCKPRSTSSITTLLLALLAVAALAACGGKPKNHYRTAVDQQESCCQRLADAAARAECLSRIVRVDDPEVQMSQLNQASFACFARHFECDPRTGTVTKEASQKQYDCMSELR